MLRLCRMAVALNATGDAASVEAGFSGQGYAERPLLPPLANAERSAPDCIAISGSRIALVGRLAKGGRSAPDCVVRFLAALAVVAVLLPAVARAADAGQPGFNRDIRPLLSDKCFKCHGPDAIARKADLRLDRREAAVKAEAIVPGRPDESGLIERVFSDDPQEMMPPPSSGKTLTAERVSHINRVKGLLFSQGITGYEPRRRDRREPLEELQTGDGPSAAGASEGAGSP